MATILRDRGEGAAQSPSSTPSYASWAFGDLEEEEDDRGLLVLPGSTESFLRCPFFLGAGGEVSSLSSSFLPV